MDMMSFGSMTIATLIFLLTYFVYKRILRPYWQFNRYRELLPKHYNTRINPFFVVGTLFIKLQKEDLQKYGDSQHTIKYQYRNHQLALNSFAGKLFLDLIDPQLIREFYQKSMDGCYIKMVGFPFMSGIKSIIGSGLVFSEGEEWKKKRRIMSTVFNYDFIKSKIPTIAKICSQTLDQVQKSVQNTGKDNIKVDVLNLLQKVFGNVVIKCFFGDIQLDSIDGEQIFTFMNDLMQKNTKRSMTLFAFVAGPKFFKYNLRTIDRQVSSGLKRFQKYAKDIIKSTVSKTRKVEVTEEGGYRGIIDLLIKQDKFKQTDGIEQNESYKDLYIQTDLIDEFKTFFMAGTDTTANNTTVLIYQLAKYPEVLAKAKQQIHEVMGDDSEITFQQLKKLTYMDCIQKQALRMYGPSAGIFMRQAVKDHYLGKIPIRKGMLVSIKIKSNHFKEQFYTNPQLFRPQRWENIDSSKVDPFSYFPFSSGQRNCIGQHLALLESKIVLVTILRRYKTIDLQKPDFRLYMRTLYGAQKMTTTFGK